MEIVAHLVLLIYQEPYGIKTSKRCAFKEGARPVIYLPVNEANRILDPSEYWRVVRLDLNNKDDSVCFLHEREWRCKGSFRLAVNFVNVFVKTKKEAATIRKLLNKSGESFPADEYRVKSLEEIEKSYA